MTVLEELEKIKMFVSCDHPQEAVYLCETEAYKTIKKDLELLEILKNQIRITEIKENHMIYNLDITIKDLNWEQFYKIREWLENEK